MKQDAVIETFNLRKKAEKLSKLKPARENLPHSEADILKLIHELEVHQIELELQNEELELSKEREAASASEKYAELYDFAPSGCFTLTKNGVIIGLNLCAAQMLGKERAHLKNNHFDFFVSVDTKPNLHLFLKKIFNSKTKETCEVALTTNGNPPIYVYLTGIATENGKQCLVTTIDISERKQNELILKGKNEEIETKNQEYLQLNETLQQSNAELLTAKEHAEESDRLKSAFLHNISHEIRTPLNAIVGFSQFLNNPSLLHEKRQRFTDIIEFSSQQLLSIVSDIIKISTIEAGQEKIYEAEMNLNATLKLLHEQYLLKAKKQNICLTLKPFLPDNQVNILSDETKLVQVLFNILNNALKFTEQGYVIYGYTIVETENAPSLLQFFVEDTGIGIPAQMHDKIFNRFRQVETTDSRKFGGSGLGLSISKAYVEMLGGKMWLTSELGKGSVFYFTIPYKQVNPKILPDIPSIKGLRFEFKTPKTILIAEDEDSNFMLLEELLSDMGINIIRAVNGLEAVELCKINPNINLVLMDIKMPEMDGYEATIRIKEFKPDLYIIAQTAYSTEADKNKALACGCSDFMSKPLKRELLVSKINEQLLK